MNKLREWEKYMRQRYILCSKNEEKWWSIMVREKYKIKNSLQSELAFIFIFLCANLQCVLFWNIIKDEKEEVYAMVKAKEKMQKVRKIDKTVNF